MTQRQQNLLPALGWAFFLAVSWTWCIGMFLPVLLIHDMGAWVWLAFALPNVLGAAAMGWVIRRKEDSEALIQSHRLAFMSFSVVTVAFHAMFITWLFGNMPTTFISGILLVVCVQGILIGGLLRGKAMLLSAVAIWFVSVGVTSYWLYELNQLFEPAFGGDTWLPALDGARPTWFMDLVFLVPVMILGFAACPYFDLTFHRAASNLDRRARRLAFSLGFGFLFLGMIVLTFLYARPIDLLLPTWAIGQPQQQLLSVVIPTLFSVHVGMQAGLTGGYHLREVAAVGQTKQTRTWGLAICLIVAGLVAFITHAMNQMPTDKQTSPLLAGELLYRIFMGFYGLVFPTYALLFLLPSRGTTDQPVTQKDWLVFGVTVILALPFFWYGFIAEQYVFLLPGVAVMLLGRMALRLVRNMQPIVAA